MFLFIKENIHTMNGINGTEIPNSMPPAPSQIVYVWTGTGSLLPLEVPMDLITGGETAVAAVATVPATHPKEAPKKEPATEGFDNLRRTNSAVNQYIEIPSNNIVSTRNQYETIPLFRLRVEPNKKYRLNVVIRAKTDYKFAVPILARYYVEADAPNMIKEYRATYVSSNETVNGAEKTMTTLGGTMIMVVDSKLSIIKISASFIGGNLATELRIHHGIKTDDPDAILYCLEGSHAILSEIIEVL